MEERCCTSETIGFDRDIVRPKRQPSRGGDDGGAISETFEPFLPSSDPVFTAIISIFRFTVTVGGMVTRSLRYGRNDCYSDWREGVFLPIRNWVIETIARMVEV